MKKVRPVVGLLPMACTRFRGMGKGTSALYEQRIQHRLDEIEAKCAMFSEVINPGQVYTQDDVQKVMDLFYQKKVDCVFAFFLSWTLDDAWNKFLRDMYPIPLFFAHIRPDIHYTNTEEDDDFVEYLSTGALVGALEASGSFKRFSRPMSFTAAGRVDDVLKEVEPFACASAMRADLRSAKFSLVGGFPEIMWSTYCDPFTYYANVGPQLHFIDIAQLEDAYNAVSEKRVDDSIKILSDKYPPRGKIEMDHYRASVRCSIALEDVIRQSGSAMGILNDGNSTLFSHIGLRPGFYPTPENDGSIGVVPEGDLGVGLAVYIAMKLTGEHVNIIELAHIEDDDRVKVVHAGPNDYTDCAGKTLIARDIRFAKTNYKHAGAPFAWHVIAPGEKTLIHCSQGKDGRYKLVTIKAVGQDMDHELASYTHGCLTFPGRNVNDICSALLEEGVTQHYALVGGDCVAKVRCLAKILDMDYKEI